MYLVYTGLVSFLFVQFSAVCRVGTLLRLRACLTSGRALTPSLV